MPVKRSPSPLGLPELLSLAGLASCGYGLWIVAPWLMFVGVGAVLFVVGILIGRHP